VVPEPIVPPRSPLGNLDEILPNPNTRVLTGTEANALNTPNRGVIYVQENSSMSQAARDFQSGCTGAFCDPVSGRDAAPALRFDNNVTNGNNFIRFDGIERSADGQGIVLIDRKLRLADFNRGAIASTETTFRRVAEAVRQNPGYQVVYEFPNQAALTAANNLIRDLKLQGVVTTRIAGPR
jgi:filamentous hemagglutinin